MKLQFLGTAAAEGIPALFCRCKNCQIARRRGGRDLRSRAQSLVDGKILIDWSPDSLYHSFRFGIDYSNITTVLITHSHGDHFLPTDFDLRKKGFAHLEGCRRMTVYGSEDIKAPLANSVVEDDTPLGIRVQVVHPFEPFEAEGYKITPLVARHGTEHPHLYAIEKEGKSLLYAHDTSMLLEENYDYIRKNGMRFDLVTLDCCHFDAKGVSGTGGHMSLDNNVIVRDRLREIGAIHDDTILYCNHFSHNSPTATYDEMVEIARRYGFRVAYDGLEVEF